MGLRIVLADVDENGLLEAANQVSDIVGDANVVTVLADVSKLEDVQRLKEKAYDAFGEVGFTVLLPPNLRLSDDLGD